MKTLHTVNPAHRLIAVVALAFAFTAAAPAAAQVKIAHIDPYSGPAAAAGILGRKHSQLFVDRLNAAGGLAGQKIELSFLDNKFNPQEAGLMLQKAISDGARYVITGNSSALVHSMLDAIKKHNERQPGKEVVLLNHWGIDPALSNESCSFWHFRFQADSDMATLALADYAATRPDIKKVYTINQDYAYGRSVAAAIRKYFKEKRPDLETVADEFVPTMKVNDFSPYVAKIKASKADAVVTSNWGPDMLLLFKAARDAGLDVDWLTYAGAVTGSVTAIGRDGIGKVRSVVSWHKNAKPAMGADMVAFEKRFDGDDFYYISLNYLYDMLAAAAAKAGSADPVKVARALENLSIESDLGPVTMRADNHQLLLPQFVGVYSDKVPHDIERTGIGLATDIRVEGRDVNLPTTCKMADRPL